MSVLKRSLFSVQLGQLMFDTQQHAESNPKYNETFNIVPEEQKLRHIRLYEIAREQKQVNSTKHSL